MSFGYHPIRSLIRRPNTSHTSPITPKGQSLQANVPEDIPRSDFTIEDLFRKSSMERHRATTMDDPPAANTPSTASSTSRREQQQYRSPSANRTLPFSPLTPNRRRAGSASTIHRRPLNFDSTPHSSPSHAAYNRSFAKFTCNPTASSTGSGSQQPAAGFAAESIETVADSDDEASVKLPSSPNQCKSARNLRSMLSAARFDSSGSLTATHAILSTEPNTPNAPATSLQKLNAFPHALDAGHLPARQSLSSTSSTTLAKSGFTIVPHAPNVRLSSASVSAFNQARISPHAQTFRLFLCEFMYSYIRTVLVHSCLLLCAQKACETAISAPNLLSTADSIATSSYSVLTDPRSETRTPVGQFQLTSTAQALPSILPQNPTTAFTNPTLTPTAQKRVSTDALPNLQAAACYPFKKQKSTDTAAQAPPPGSAMVVRQLLVTRDGQLARAVGRRSPSPSDKQPSITHAEPSILNASASTASSKQTAAAPTAPTRQTALPAAAPTAPTRQTALPAAALTVPTNQIPEKSSLVNKTPQKRSTSNAMDNADVSRTPKNPRMSEHRQTTTTAAAAPQLHIDLTHSDDQDVSNARGARTSPVILQTNTALPSQMTDTSARQRTLNWLQTDESLEHGVGCGAGDDPMLSVGTASNTMQHLGPPSNSSATSSADASSSRIPQGYTLVSPAPLVPLSRQCSRYFDFPSPEPSAINAESSSVINVSAAVSAPICPGMPSTFSPLAAVNELH